MPGSKKPEFQVSSTLSVDANKQENAIIIEYSDWLRLRDQISKLQGGRLWEIFTSIVSGVCVAAVFTYFTLPQDSPGHTIYLVVAFVSFAITIVSLVALATIKRITSASKESLLSDMDGIEVDMTTWKFKSGSTVARDLGDQDVEKEGDQLYTQAKEVVREKGRASASMLQRHLYIGYARAARLLDELEKDGIIGPADGARPRDIL